MKKFVKFLTSSRFLLALMFVINVLLFVAAMTLLPNYVYPLFSTICALLLVSQVSKHADTSANALVWLIVIVLMPFFGTALYVQLHTARCTKSKKRKFQNVSYQSFKTLEQNQNAIETLSKFDLGSANISKFVLNTEKWPVYTDTLATYLNDGEAYFNDMFATIQKAKKYVLVEYFQINSGKMWERLFDILRLKAREGVEVKFLYDEYGCMDSFEDDKFFKKLNNHGIETVAFNKIVPAFNTFNQCRDHRKLVIVDGNIAYVSGVNVSDESANLKEKYGIWKDGAIKLEGSAVWSYVVMFFNNWQVSAKKFVDVTKYKVTYSKNAKIKDIVQPYATSPLTKAPISKAVLLKLINSARKYVYIVAPYLMLDHDVLQSLKLVAYSGVEVKLVLPGISNKKSLYYLTRSYYTELIKAGVKVYEYSPGYIHTKMVVVDDNTAVLGSTNLDFRKLNVHFEAGVIVHSSKAVTAMKQDVDSLVGSCHTVTLRDCKQRKIKEKLAARFLKFFSPFV